MTTQTGCGAEQSTSVCVSVFAGGSRQCVGFSRSHAYLYEGFAEGGCPSDSVLHSSWPSKTNSIETSPLVCCFFFFSCATCVYVTVGFVPPQSLTHVDYLYLRQKASASHIL